MTRRYVMLDRDGTFIVERHYLRDPELVELIPGAAEGLRRLAGMGLGLIVITNQSALGRGYVDQAGLDKIHRCMCDLLDAEGVHLDGIYVCPHIPEDACPCRKPSPGLVERAAAELGFDPRAGFVVGDKECDVELGRSVGATTILVRTGYGAQTAAEGTVRPDHVVDDVREAAAVVQRLLATQKEALTHATG